MESVGWGRAGQTGEALVSLHPAEGRNPVEVLRNQREGCLDQDVGGRSEGSRLVEDRHGPLVGGWFENAVEAFVAERG